MSDIHTAVVVVGLKALDPKWPIREAFGGPAGGLSWIMQFENAAQVEEANTKLMADRDYQNLLAQAHAYFVPNTGHDQMWRQVEM